MAICCEHTKSGAKLQHFLHKCKFLFIKKLFLSNLLKKGVTRKGGRKSGERKVENKKAQFKRTALVFSSGARD